MAKSKNPIPGLGNLPGSGVLNRTIQKTSSSGQKVTSSGGSSSQTVRSSGPVNISITQGTVSRGSTTQTSNQQQANRLNQQSAAKTKAPTSGGGSGGGGGFDNLGGSGGTNSEQQSILNEYATQLQFLLSDLQAQRDFINQDASLDDQERALALQELDTQLNFARQQSALTTQQIQSNIDETQRQRPLNLRDIADQFAAQGAYYSGRRAFTQDEADHAAQLAIQGLERQLRGEELSQEERDALGAVQRGQINLGGLRDDLQTQMDLYNLQHGYDVESHNLTYNKDQQVKQADKQLSESALFAGFEAGTITGPQLRQALQNLGYSPDEATFLSQTENAQFKAQKAQAQADATKNVSPTQLETAFRQGLITESAYVGSLQSLGYPKEQAQLLAASAVQKGPLSADGGKSLSVGQLTSMYKADLLGKADLAKGIEAQGYTSAQASALADLAEVQKTKSGSSAKTLSKTDLESSYRGGVIDKSSLASGLANLGYSPSQVKILVAKNEAAKKKSGTTSAGGKTPATQVGGQIISASRGASMGDPTNFIADHYDSYGAIKTEVLYLSKQYGREPTPSEIVSWKRASLKGAYAGKSASEMAKGLGLTYQKGWGTDDVATAYIAKYSAGYSLALYRTFYGGEQKYPYKPAPYYVRSSS